MGKIGRSHDFQSKRINFNAKKGKERQKKYAKQEVLSESILTLKRAKILGKIGDSHDFQSK